MKNFIFLVGCLSVFCSLQNVFGQSNTTQMPDQSNTEVRSIGSLDQRRTELDSLSKRSNTQVFGINRTLILPKVESEAIKAALPLNEDDLTKYKSFLEQPNTGLFRLMPNIQCPAEKYVVHADDDCANIIPGSQYYSFRQKNYVNGLFFDLTFVEDRLFDRSALSQTIITQSGDVPLDDVSLRSKGVNFIADFVPANKSIDIKKQFAEIRRGIDSEGFYYSTTEKAFLNTTYILRVTAYQLDKKTMKRLEGRKITGEKYLIATKGDQRDDVIVAFRILRQNDDKSLNILWKELSRKKSPEIIYEKKELITDINKKVLWK